MCAPSWVDRKATWGCQASLQMSVAARCRPPFDAVGPGVLPGQEVLALLERRVGRQVELAVGVDEPAVLVVARAVVGVQAVAAGLGEPDEHPGAAGALGDPQQPRVVRGHREVVRDVAHLVARERELGEHHEVRAGVGGLGDHALGALDVAVDVPERGVGLGERDAHAGSSGSSPHAAWGDGDSTRAPGRLSATDVPVARRGRPDRFRPAAPLRLQTRPAPPCAIRSVHRGRRSGRPGPPLRARPTPDRRR